MQMGKMVDTSKNYWFLGACRDGNDDLSEYFINSGTWLYYGQNNKEINLIQSIQTGDRIAIKTAYVQKNKLPFDNKGYPIPVLKIKAIGTVLQNPGDGKSLKVDWDKNFSEKKWYFYTKPKTIWKVIPSNWQDEELINFTFHNQLQDINRFCNAPYWQKRFCNVDINKLELTKSRWKQTVLEFIKELCHQNNSEIFSRQQILEYYQQRLKELFPDNNTIEQSVSRTLQELRDQNILQFVTRGQYKLSDYDLDITEHFSADIQENSQDYIVRPFYSLKDLINEGCFVDPQQLEIILERLKEKKNLILQGPPGTGKTWLAKRLANVMVGFQDFDNIKVIQFHPNMSYEDFIRGYRPSCDGKLELIDGPFIEMANRARYDPNTNYVLVIEEINRGNPAQIFGEMLTLLEANKRNYHEAMELTYKRNDETVFFIPDNLYVIGTMNISDRSLAMFDLALRRRFAFFTLQPNFGKQWLSYMAEKTAIAPEKLEDWQQRMLLLNQKISDDPMLGKAFTIGHSYLTTNKPVPDADTWYKNIIDTEIRPLLTEYWLNDPNKIDEAIEALLSDVC